MLLDDQLSGLVVDCPLRDWELVALIPGWVVPMAIKIVDKKLDIGG